MKIKTDPESVLYWLQSSETSLAGTKFDAAAPWLYTMRYTHRGEQVWAVDVPAKTLEKLVKDKKVTGTLSPDHRTIIYRLKVAS